jgi:hypothetical protein
MSNRSTAAKLTEELLGAPLHFPWIDLWETKWDMSVTAAHCDLHSWDSPVSVAIGSLSGSTEHRQSPANREAD